ncbi:MAG: glycoside hydrolase family 2 protein [Armatimonadota bacterium]
MTLITGITGAVNAKTVGVVDHKLVSRDGWINQWKEDWESQKIVDLFQKDGIDAAVIDDTVLRDLNRLKSYKAIMIPADACYPDIGSSNGLISKNIAEYVKSGGVYIMPLGNAHSRWMDTETGRVSDAPMQDGKDILGLEWHQLTGASIAARAIITSALGSKIGIQKPAMLDLGDPGGWAVNPGSLPLCSFVDDGTTLSRLYAVDLGDGYVIHFAGGSPFDREKRNWLISAYASILKNMDSRSVKAERSLATKTRIYSTLPVASRSRTVSGKDNESCEVLLDGVWELAEAKGEFTPTAEDAAAQVEWIPVDMPNTIQYAMLKAGRIENPWWADNHLKMQWIQQKDWYLRRQFSIPDNWQGKQIRLDFGGVDYLAGFWLDGVFLGMHEGMFGGPTFDLTKVLTPGKEHELMLRFIHNPGPQMKPLCLTGWTIWGNRCATLGLWQSVRLVSTGSACLEAPYVRTDSITRNSAKLWAQARVINNNSDTKGVVRARIVDLTTNTVVWHEEKPRSIPAGVSYWEREIELPSPKLWWPNGMGSQPLYRLELDLLIGEDRCDSIGTKFGVRTIELKRNPASDDSPRGASCTWDTDYTKEPLVYEAMRDSDESQRFLFVVNGRPFYANGTNWHIADGMFAEKQVRQEWYVKAAKLSGINLFRLNAGNALYEDERFYDLCDESGILIWQDIHICGGRSTDVSLPVWREQLTRTVQRLRQHPCLALYVGGNEYTPYRDLYMPVLGLAREIVASYDDKPFRMSSSAGGSFHYPAYDQKDVCFNAEWHFSYGFGNYSQFKRTLPPEQLECKSVGYDFTKFGDEHPLFRNQFLEWGWLIPHYWPPASWYIDLDKANTEDFIEAQQMFRSDVNGYAAEQMRSRFPSVGGHTFWGFNPQAPTSAWHVVDWFGQPQINYYTLKRAHEPVHVMAKLNTNHVTPAQMFIGDWFSIAPGKEFNASVCALNNKISVKNARITAKILGPKMQTILEDKWTVDLPADGYPGNSHDITWAIPSDTPKAFYFLELTMSNSKGKQLSQQVYYFRVHSEEPRAITKSGPWLEPQMANSPTTISAAIKEVRQLSAKEAVVVVDITNTGPNPAFPVDLRILPDTYSVIWSDNFFWLRSGEHVTVQGLVRCDMTGLDLMTQPKVAKLSDLTLEINAWNSNTLKLVLSK